MLPTDDLLDLAATRAKRYLTDVDARDVAPSDVALRGLDTFDEPLPEIGRDAIETIDLLDRVGSPATMAGLPLSPP